MSAVGPLSFVMLDSSDQDGPFPWTLIEFLTRVSPVEFVNGKIVIKIYTEVTKK
jgi:hypothetical protein